MKWDKAPQELVSFLEETARGVEGSQKRMMFGFPCYFINGNMYMAAHEERLILRVGGTDREALITSGGGFSSFEPTAGRVMKEYVVVPRDVYADQARFNPLLEKCLQYVRELPAKKAKSVTRRGKSTR